MSRLAWFATEAGKKFSFGCVTTTSIGITMAHFLPQTMLLDKYKEFVQMYRTGLGVLVPERLQLLVEQVMDDLEVPEVERTMMKPFTVIGFDVFHAGTTYSKFGAIIGIPMNFTYTDASTIDATQILIRNETVNWSRPEGKNLLNALVLSKDAQKFAIGREILRSRTLEPALNTLYPMSVIAIVFGLAHGANQKFNSFARPLSFRMILYSLIGLFGFGSWAFLKDFTTVYYDEQCDKILSALGLDYVKGGQEFYGKMLHRNIALRSLMGSAGEKVYTTTGNEHFFIRQKRLPVTHRKTFFDDVLKNFQAV